MNAPITRRLPVALALLTLCGPGLSVGCRPPGRPIRRPGRPTPPACRRPRRRRPSRPRPAPCPPDASPWTALANTAPDSISTMLLLTDGTVMAQGYGGTHEGDSAHWYKLTPDNTGSYVNGTWTTLTDMHHSRLFLRFRRDEKRQSLCGRRRVQRQSDVHQRGRHQHGRDLRSDWRTSGPSSPAPAGATSGMRPSRRWPTGIIC